MAELNCYNDMISPGVVMGNNPVLPLEYANASPKIKLLGSLTRAIAGQ